METCRSNGSRGKGEVLLSVQTGWQQLIECAMLVTDLLPHIREQLLLAINMQAAEDSVEFCDMAHVLHPLLSIQTLVCV